MQPSLARRPKFNLTGLLLLTATIGAAFGVSFAITLRWSNPQMAAPALFGGLQLFSPKDFPGQRLENANFQGSEGAFEHPGGEGHVQPTPDEPPVMHEEVLPRVEAPTEQDLPPEEPKAQDIPPTEPSTDPEPYAGPADLTDPGPIESEPIIPDAEAAAPSAAAPLTPEPTAPVAPPVP